MGYGPGGGKELATAAPPRSHTGGSDARLLSAFADAETPLRWKSSLPEGRERRASGPPGA